MDGFLSKIVSPKRVNLASLIYSQRKHLSHFDQKQFSFLTFDNLKLNCILFHNNAHTKSETSFLSKFGQGIQKIISKDNFQAKQDENDLARKMKDSLIVYNHSHGSSKFEGSHLLTLCVEHEMSLLLYDSRACGESDGEMISFGKNEKIDLMYLLLKVQVDFGFKQFLLWGRSIGCNSIINFLYEMEMNKSEYLNEVIKKKRQESEELWQQSGRQGKVNRRRMIVEYPTDFFNRFFNKTIASFGQNNNVKDWKDRKFHITIIGSPMTVLQKH
jgi:hypothetical protein